MNNLGDVENWLKEHSINNYTISEDFHVSVQGNVNLNDKLKGQNLPILFDRIEGYFDISNNNLTSLVGCPNVVAKDFNCSKNKLASLFDCPVEVGEFDCSHNLLKNLSYGPKEVKGNYNCSFNELTSIKASPRTIKGYFRCNDNKLASLDGGPKNIDDDFDCSHNFLERLNGGPITVKHDYLCHGNKLSDLEGIADEIGGDLVTDIKLSNVLSKFNEEDQSSKYKGSEVIAHIYKPVVSLVNNEDIVTWLNRFDVKSYTILSDGSVDVAGDVKLSGRLPNLYKLPLKFNIIDGDFDISENELVSLEGSPVKVNGNFLAHKNELSSLRGGPKEVKGSFIVLHNNITSLQNAPTSVKGDFICSHNPLRSLEGINTILGYIFTGVYIPRLKCQKYNYKGVTTYKYPGDTVMKYLDEEYISLTDEEKAFEATKKNLEKVIKKMLNSNTLTKEMINDTLLKNLTKYQLDQLKTKVLWIKNPPNEDNSDVISEDEIMKLAFEKEL